MPFYDISMSIPYFLRLWKQFEGSVLCLRPLFSKTIPIKGIESQTWTDNFSGEGMEVLFETGFFNFLKEKKRGDEIK